jgi:hypothetical protein
MEHPLPVPATGPEVDLPSLTSGQGFGRALSRLRPIIERFAPRSLARLDAAVIVLLGVMGALEFFTPAHLRMFDLDAEGTFPSAFSGGLLFAAALLAVVIAQTGSWVRRERQSLWFIAAFFAFMGVDEGIMIHERVGTALHMHWQIPYLPLVVVAAVLWLRVLRALFADPPAATLWIAGAAVWVGAQGFEVLQSAVAPEYGTVHGTVNLHFALTIVEEMGEMAGSSLFLFALLLFYRSQIMARPKRKRTRIALAEEPNPSPTESGSVS